MMNENTSTISKPGHPSHEEITRKAKDLWEDYGRPAGRDEEIWLEAERLLAMPSSAPAERPVDTPMKNTAAITAETGIAGGQRPAPPRRAKTGKR